MKKLLAGELDELPTIAKDQLKKVLREETDYVTGKCRVFSLVNNITLLVAWLVAHRAACLDAPEKFLEVVRAPL